MVHHASFGGLGWRDAVILWRIKKWAIECHSKLFCRVSVRVPKVLGLGVLVRAFAPKI
jgi:hypothetical protein